MSSKPEYEVGDVVYLTDYGARVLAEEFGWRTGERLAEGATAVVKSVSGQEKWTNIEYIVEFFAWPGREWGAYYGEIRSIHDR